MAVLLQNAGLQLCDTVRKLGLDSPVDRPIPEDLNPGPWSGGCKWVQCTHLQIWMPPLRICEISKTNMLSDPFNTRATRYRVHVLHLDLP
jgi:hypothetical protein